jgi:hypothetical protein
MASNKDLQAEIEALSTELGVSIPEGLHSMKNPRLLEVLEGLQARKTAGPIDTGGMRAITLDTSPSPAVLINLEPGSPGATAPQAAHQSSPSDALDSRLGYPSLFFVCDGKSITTKKGQVDGKPRRIAAHQEVRARDFPGGQAELDALVASGVVVKRDRT